MVLLKRKANLVEVIDKRNRAVLARCYIGDEDNVEKIADILSAKGHARAAMELRELARADRRNAIALTRSRKSKIIHLRRHPKRRGIHNSGVAWQKPRGT